MHALLITNENINSTHGATASWFDCNDWSESADSFTRALFSFNNVYRVDKQFSAAVSILQKLSAQFSLHRFSSDSTFWCDACAYAATSNAVPVYMRHCSALQGECRPSSISMLCTSLCVRSISWPAIICSLQTICLFYPCRARPSILLPFGSVVAVSRHCLPSKEALFDA